MSNTKTKPTYYNSSDHTSITDVEIEIMNKARKELHKRGYIPIEYDLVFLSSFGGPRIQKFSIVADCAGGPERGLDRLFRIWVDYKISPVSTKSVLDLFHVTERISNDKTGQVYYKDENNTYDDRGIRTKVYED
ncbi:hypothetical protein [uncultured Mediterranean phage uvMED]|nr:hypothetical protein [uncultured Mediterranean phage uvMED]BAR19692.1 hypothetical protein [uncultured Mediterranean phage uvMED]